MVSCHGGKPQHLFLSALVPPPVLLLQGERAAQPKGTTAIPWWCISEMMVCCAWELLNCKGGLCVLGLSWSPCRRGWNCGSDVWRGWSGTETGQLKEWNRYSLKPAGPAGRVEREESSGSSRQSRIQTSAPVYILFLPPYLPQPLPSTSSVSGPVCAQRLQTALRTIFVGNTGASLHPSL